MQMKARVLQLLRGHDAARIRFTVMIGAAAITINKASFTMVANAMIHGKIGVTAFAPTALVGAQYTQPASAAAPTSGQLLVPPILGREDESAVMHECTHAFFDLTSTHINATHEEAVCYIVGALYNRMNNLKPGRWTQTTQSAGVIAKAALHHYAMGSPGVPIVDAGEFRRLSLTVSLRPTYFLPTKIGDSTPAGLLGGILGGPTQYVHNG